VGPPISDITRSLGNNAQELAKFLLLDRQTTPGAERLHYYFCGFSRSVGTVITDLSQFSREIAAAASLARAQPTGFCAASLNQIWLRLAQGSLFGLLNKRGRENRLLDIPALWPCQRSLKFWGALAATTRKVV
jgi:hypothetical protein